MCQSLLPQPKYRFHGCCPQVVDTGLINSSQRMVLGELRCLMVWLGLQLGLVAPHHAQAILSAAFCEEVLDLNHGKARARMMAAGVKLLQCLEEVSLTANEQRR